jgi:pimeloyl-ACP methyl ester carboxylesterase
MNEPRVKSLVLFLLLLLSVGSSFGQTTAPATPVPTGKDPVIIIPGLTGSDLVNSKTGEEVWFKNHRSKDDDLRLPISANLSTNHDSLVSQDILRSVKFLKILPETEIYERLIDALQTRGGYREAKWGTSAKKDAQDTFYVFPYDWRRDNVESARLLIRRIEALKRRLGKPNLKFNIIAHSMGGLVARYAAMYGSADLSATPVPSWTGGRHFAKIFLLGTPNEGSIESLSSLLNGFSYVGGGLNLPFIQNITRFDVFTIPAAYQLLPPPGAFVAYDESFNPIQIDIYDPANWEKYDWAIWKDAEFTKKFNTTEQQNSPAFLTAALNRAKLFHAALAASGVAKPPVSFYLVGADCKETSAAVLLLRDEKKGRWETRFKAEGFTRSNGEKVKSEDVKNLLISVGDSVVTKRSLTGESQRASLPITEELYQCVAHNKLVTSPEVQDKLFAFLSASAATPVASP